MINTFHLSNLFTWQNVMQYKVQKYFVRKMEVLQCKTHVTSNQTIGYTDNIVFGSQVIKSKWVKVVSL